jgi:hypothetical protein
MPQRFNLVSYAEGKLTLFEQVTFESVDVALRRFLDLNLKAVFEVVKRAVELRPPQYALEVFAVRERKAGGEKCVVHLALLRPLLGERRPSHRHLFGLQMYVAPRSAINRAEKAAIKHATSQGTIREQLDAIVGPPDFAQRSAALVATWLASDIGQNAPESILRFMEDHPEIDYGMPGPLVHFLERAPRATHEARLLDSIARKPTFVTVWMLNRLLNGTQDPVARRRQIAALSQAENHAGADAEAREWIRKFLDKVPE